VALPVLLPEEAREVHVVAVDDQGSDLDTISTGLAVDSGGTRPSQ
jgi:hypothetical protein